MTNVPAWDTPMREDSSVSKLVKLSLSLYPERRVDRFGFLVGEMR